METLCHAVCLAVIFRVVLNSIVAVLIYDLIVLNAKFKMRSFQNSCITIPMLAYIAAPPSGEKNPFGSRILTSISSLSITVYISYHFQINRESLIRPFQRHLEGRPLNKTLSASRKKTIIVAKRLDD